MEQQFIAVTERAPRLAKLDAVLAQKFLREYASYLNRVAGGGIVAMARCLERDDLDELVDATDGIFEILLPGPVGAAQGEVVAGEAEEGQDAGSEEEDEDSTVNSSVAPVGARGPQRFVRLSDEHVTAMLVWLLGPADIVEAGALFRKLKMPHDEVAFTSVMQATSYTRAWKVTEEWCELHLPNERALVKLFIKGIYPKRLAEAVELERCKTLKQVKMHFINHWKVNCTAKKRLTGSGGMEMHADMGKANMGEKTNSPRVPYVRTAGVVPNRPIVPQPRVYPIGGPAAGAPRGPIPQAKGPATAPTCYQCGQVGHIRPNCPQKASASVPLAKPMARLGSMRRRGNTPTTRAPVIKVEVQCSPDEMKLILECVIDTGAELNFVGQSWVSAMELLGAVPVSHPPVEVGWVSDAKFVVHSSIELLIQIAGTTSQRVVEFQIAPEFIILDGFVLGWPEIQGWGLLPHLDRVLVLQRELGLLGVADPGDGNMLFKGMDGDQVETDNFLWHEDRKSTVELPELGDALSPEQAVLVRACLLSTLACLIPRCPLEERMWNLCAFR
jgi:hypothetical protein